MDSSDIFTAPTYTLNSNNFSDVGKLFDAVDSRLTKLSGQASILRDSAHLVAVDNGLQVQRLVSLKREQRVQRIKGGSGSQSGGNKGLSYTFD